AGIVAFPFFPCTCALRFVAERANELKVRQIILPQSCGLKGGLEFSDHRSAWAPWRPGEFGCLGSHHLAEDVHLAHAPLYHAGIIRGDERSPAFNRTSSVPSPRFDSENLAWARI